MAYGGNSASCANGGPSVGSGIVNQQTRAASGATAQNRVGQTGDQVVSELSPQYALGGNNGEYFCAGNQTGVTFTVGLATTYTGFILINPIGSGKNAEVVFANATLSIAATVPGPIGLIGGGSAAGVTAYTAISTALWGTTRLDSNAATNTSVCAVAAAGITLVGAPRYVAWLGLAGTVATTSLGLAPGITQEWRGCLSVGPGGYLAFGSNVAEATLLCSFVWRESFIQA